MAGISKKSTGVNR